MKRRTFLQSSLTAGVAAPFSIDTLREFFMKTIVAPLPRRPYKDGVSLSILGMGGIVIMGMPQKEANATVSEAVERGINYYDVAPSYGDGEAEVKLGPALQPHRRQVFLACKTMKRDAAGARAELERSLKRLRTDALDLYQFHAVTEMREVEEIFSKGGALETFLKARDEGLVRFIGFSAHSEAAALAMMDRFSFDSVLFPINFVCYEQGRFGPAVVRRAKEKGVARLALKAMALTRWKEGERHTCEKCWYRPIDRPELIKQALRFTLSEDVTAALPPGDQGLFRSAVEAVADFSPMKEKEREALLEQSRNLTPLFSA